MQKYKVTQEFMDALNEWNDNNKYKSGVTLINEYTINELPKHVLDWLFRTYGNIAEKNKRFGAIINWINGEYVFDIVNPKYVVQIKDNKAISGRKYLKLEADGEAFIFYGLKNATRFDDFEKASEWANKHFEVVEVDE